MLKLRKTTGAVGVGYGVGIGTVTCLCRTTRSAASGWYMVVVYAGVAVLLVTTILLNNYHTTAGNNITSNNNMPAQRNNIEPVGTNNKQTQHADHLSQSASRRARKKTLSPTTLVPERTRSLIIYTRYRSGSSFVGSLFLSNPHIYYLFEPLKMIESSEEVSGLGEKDKAPVYNKHLRKFFRCQFQQAVNATTLDSWPKRAFCTRDYTPACVHSTIQQHEQTCRAAEYKVSKDIVVPSLQGLREDGTGLGEEVDILQLVRDPRGILSSRLKINDKKLVDPQERIAKELYKIRNDCRKLHSDLMYVMSQDVSRYLLVRYEDVAVDPLRYSKQIYDKLMFPYDDHVTLWINTMTKDNTTDSHDPWTVTRDSRSTPFIWLHHLTDDVIREIEQICRKPMQLLGYKPVRKKARGDEQLSAVIRAVIGSVHQRLHKYSL